MNNTFEQVFLSDLCGREELVEALSKAGKFLSDLCGREVV